MRKRNRSKRSWEQVRIDAFGVGGGGSGWVEGEVRAM